MRDLLLEAIRYGEQPEVRARLDTAVDQALDHSALQDLLEERQLVHDAMDASRVQLVSCRGEIFGVCLVDVPKLRQELYLGLTPLPNLPPKPQR